MENLFENKTTNGDGDIIQITDGGYRNIKATGTFDGATITLNADFGDNDFAPLSFNNIPQVFIIAGSMALQPLKAGIRIKGTISSAGASTDLTLKMI